MNPVLKAKLELIRMLGTVDRAILGSERAWRISSKDDFNKSELSIRTHIDSLSYNNPLPVVIGDPEITANDMSDAICEILDGFEIVYKIKTCNFPIRLRSGDYGDADGYIILATRKMTIAEINILECMAPHYQDESSELTAKDLLFLSNKIAAAVGIPPGILNGLGGPNANGNSYSSGAMKKAMKGLISTPISVPNSPSNVFYDLWQESLKKGLKP